MKKKLYACVFFVLIIAVVPGAFCEVRNNEEPYTYAQFVEYFSLETTILEPSFLISMYGSSYDIENVLHDFPKYYSRQDCSDIAPNNEHAVTGYIAYALADGSFLYVFHSSSFQLMGVAHMVSRCTPKEFSRIKSRDEVTSVAETDPNMVFITFLGRGIVSQHYLSDGTCWEITYTISTETLDTGYVENSKYVVERITEIPRERSMLWRFLKDEDIPK